MRISESELILNPDGSIYHLCLLPGDLASTVITVGDQDRVEMVSRYFDLIEIKKQHREFKTHTGYYRGKRLSVISTGIGPDNIDIVMNEIDALVNVDFSSRTINPDISTLDIIRIGTSGAIQPDIEIDSFVCSQTGIGFDNLLHFYGNTDVIFDKEFSDAFIKHTNWNADNSSPYVVKANNDLLQKFSSEVYQPGITITNVGFYGPQGRRLRLAVNDPDLRDKIGSFEYRGVKISNLEMETAAIYGMSTLLGHRALSLNAILANRSLGTFSSDPVKAMDRLIKNTLETITK